MQGEQILIEDGQELVVTSEQAECLGARKLISRCAPCGPNIWHFVQEKTTFAEIHHVLSIIERRKKANASGQGGEDIANISAAFRASSTGTPGVLDADAALRAGLSGVAFSAATKLCFDCHAKCSDVSANRCTLCPNKAADGVQADAKGL